MKHVNAITPAKALAMDHPSLTDSIKGFAEGPADVVRVHLKKEESE